MGEPRILFVTGRLAEPALRRVLGSLAPQAGFQALVETLPITVAALMTVDWIAKRLPRIPDCDRVVLPGYTRGDLEKLQELWARPVELGPKDLRRLPEHFGRRASRDDSFGLWDIEIIAEINHAPRFSLEGLRETAIELAAAGADVIDVGCEPGGGWGGVADAVACLRDAGLRVSLDSLDPTEIRAGVAAGAELVLSLNSSNRFLAEELDVEWVVIPDEPQRLETMEETLSFVRDAGGRARIDPILEPIGLGFAASLGRYLEARRRYPETEMMMGVGNVTELSDVDSAGVNLTLAGFCQELGIRSVLTTQVIGWARSSVRELDLARRLVHFAWQRQVPPKRLDSGLVMLRDASVVEPDVADLAALSSSLRDLNYRLFVAGGRLHLVAAGIHLQGEDPFEIFDALMQLGVNNVDPSHAFYLGYELSKASVAATLGKEYRQDEALSWGILTRGEGERHRLQRRHRRGSVASEASDRQDEEGRS